MKTEAKKISYLLTLVMVLTMFVPTIVAKAASYDYTINNVKRNISVVDGKTTLTVGDNSYELTKKLVAADAALDQYGTAWILFKNGAIYWWNYDLEKDSAMITIHGLKSSTGNQVYASNFIFESDDDVTVTGYQTASGAKFNLLSLEDIKKLLSIDNNNNGSTSGDGNKDNTGNNDSNNNGNNGNTSSGDANNDNTNKDDTNKDDGKKDNDTNNSSNNNQNSSNNNTNNGNNGSSNTNNSGSQSTTTSTTTSSTGNYEDNDSSVTTTTTTVVDKDGNKTTTTTVVKKSIKCTRVTHNGSYYYLWNNNKKITTVRLKKGKLSWRGYTCKNVKTVGFIKKSQNLVVMTKSGKVFTLNLEDMTKKTIFGKKSVKAYGKAIAFNHDKHGFVTRIVTKKPKRIKVTNK